MQDVAKTVESCVVVDFVENTVAATVENQTGVDTIVAVESCYSDNYFESP